MFIFCLINFHNFFYIYLFNCKMSLVISLHYNVWNKNKLIKGQHISATYIFKMSGYSFFLIILIRNCFQNLSYVQKHVSICSNLFSLQKGTTHCYTMGRCCRGFLFFICGNSTSYNCCRFYEFKSQALYGYLTYLKPNFCIFFFFF